jgi:uncharacterized protein YecE (DUF72 family)
LVVCLFPSKKGASGKLCRIACAPRHVSWFTQDADAIMAEVCIARVGADPALAPVAAQPGGWPGLHYRRIHGSPRMYYSSCAQPCLEDLATAIVEDRSAGIEPWCIFDNTASGPALADAAKLQSLLAA